MGTTPQLTALMLAALLASAAQAQAPSPTIELPPTAISLADLNGFRATSDNWKIAGGATADRTRALALAVVPGAGVLVNRPTPHASGQLFTTWEHGDLELAFDVMLSRGSASGVYLMGRYEMRLADSWGVRVPTFADLGGISQRWDEKRGRGLEGFEGIPPRQNVSRAPGLWQHVEILFHAPRFVGQRKVANARFARVVVNGVVVHENVEVTGPTRGAAFDDERTAGPLMMQGDGGPVAVRDIRYKRYGGAVTLASLRYHLFEGDSMGASFIATHAPVREGDATAISSEAARVADKFAIVHDGMLSVPASGRYRFQLALGWIGTDSATRGATVGGGTLTIDGTPVIVHTGAERRAFADAELKAGPHAFALSYYKNRSSSNGRDVTVRVEGPGVELQALHDERAITAVAGPAESPIVVEATAEPVMIRSFIRHRDVKRITAMSVADPRGVHFSYDLATGALLYVWRGPFLETTQMWLGRGEDQTAQPLGSALTLAGAPVLAFLADARAPWPESIDEQQFKRDGYELDKTGRPTFLYHARGVAVEDAIRPGADGLSLGREVHLRAPPGAGTTDGLYLQLAAGDHIARQDDGSYVVGDGSFYITLPSGGARPIIRSQLGREELLIPVRFVRGEANVAYTIVW